jgi:hypothetical protein
MTSRCYLKQASGRLSASSKPPILINAGTRWWRTPGDPVNNPHVHDHHPVSSHLTGLRAWAGSDPHHVWHTATTRRPHDLSGRGSLCCALIRSLFFAFNIERGASRSSYIDYLLLSDRVNWPYNLATNTTESRRRLENEVDELPVAVEWPREACRTPELLDCR